MKNVYLSDKYFMSLDDFNKDLIAHKSNFFKDYQGFPFISLLNALSYNTDFNTKIIAGENVISIWIIKIFVG